MHNWRVAWGLICLRFILGKKVLEHVRYFYVLIERLFIISRRKKGWQLNISPQYHANLTQPISHKESQRFAIFVPVLTTLCVPG